MVPAAITNTRRLAAITIRRGSAGRCSMSGLDAGGLRFTGRRCLHMSEDGGAARHHICGIDELGVAPLGAAKRIVSILNPGLPVPPELARVQAELLILRFNDVIVDDDALGPTMAHIETLLAFDRDQVREDRLVVHCTAGVSRSTAALAILLAKRRPGDEAAIFSESWDIRPP